MIGTGQIGLPLDWNRPDAEFLVSEANALAVRHLDHRATWPVRTSILVGPHRSGRTTLAQRFARDTGGGFIDDAEGQADDILFHVVGSKEVACTEISVHCAFAIRRNQNEAFRSRGPCGEGFCFEIGPLGAYVVREYAAGVVLLHLAEISCFAAQ